MSILLTKPAGSGGGSNVETIHVEIPTTNTILVDSLPLATYRTAKWIVTLNDSVGGTSMAYEVLGVHDDLVAHHTRYARTGDNIPHGIDVILNGIDMALEITNNIANSLTVDVVRIATLI